jgi:putative redox protein
MTESTLTATVQYIDGMAFQADTGSGHSFARDTAQEVGGADRRPRPMEMLLVALGGCTGMDVISILRKMRQDVIDYRIHVRGERAGDHPKVFTTIVVEHVVCGRGLNPESVRHAVELSANRYCSAAGRW